MLNHANARAQQLTVSKRFLVLSGIFIVMTIFVVITNNYINLRKSIPSILALEYDISRQRDVIIFQYEQIQISAQEINSLKAKLINLNNFEKQIRNIANIEDETQKESIFGVGGTSLEDMNRKYIALKDILIY